MFRVQKMHCRIAVAGVAAIAIFLTGLLFQRWRHGPPTRMALPDLCAPCLDRIEAVTGVRLPAESRFLILPSDDPRASTGDEYWLVYSPKPFENVPLDARLNAFAQPNVQEAVKLVESEMFPFKISQPRSATYHRWTHGETDSQAQVVGGAMGWYLSLRTFQQTVEPADAVTDTATPR
jgi:hypothetical protein